MGNFEREFPEKNLEKKNLNPKKWILRRKINKKTN